MAMKASKIENVFLRCKETMDYIKFATSMGAKIRHVKHWVIDHPNGSRSTISSTPGKKSRLDKTRKEFGEAYNLTHLIQRKGR